MHNNEKIMVCVYYGPNGERLILRGYELAQLLNCSLVVLSVVPHSREALDEEQEQYMSIWESLCQERGATFIVKTGGELKTSDIIAATVKEHHVTQLVIGESGQTRWSEITQGSFVNDLLHRIGPADLHIVTVQRTVRDDSIDHEPAVRVTVRKIGERYVIDDSEEIGEVIAEGLFFRDQNTDFDNGQLKVKIDGVYRYARVNHGDILDSTLFEPRKP